MAWCLTSPSPVGLARPKGCAPPGRAYETAVCFRRRAGVSSALRCWTKPDPLAWGLWSEPSHQPSEWRARWSRRRETIEGSRPQRNHNLWEGRSGERTQAQANSPEQGPQALPAIQVPATVQAVLATRIDRLAPQDKGLLQTAAVLGTDVPFGLLRAIAGVPEAALAQVAGR